MTEVSDMEILVHDEMQLVDWGESRAGGPWVKLKLRDPELLEPFRGMDTATQKHAGHILHVTIAQGDIAALAESTPETTAPYGQEAATLRRSGFFQAPAVWPHIGTDADFLAWLRTQRCANPECEDPKKHVEAAHVRRVANGSGTSVKPEYSAISLCRVCHAGQHVHGESAFAGGRQWFDMQRNLHLERWGWQRLKHALGYEHWNEVPPDALRVWVEGRGIKKLLLPVVYRDANLESET